MGFQYHELGNGFIVELAYAEQKTSTVFPNDTKNQDRLSQILKIIQSDNKVSIMKLSKDLGTSRITIIPDIDKLKDQGRIQVFDPLIDYV